MAPKEADTQSQGVVGGYVRYAFLVTSVAACVGAVLIVATVTLVGGDPKVILWLPVVAPFALAIGLFVAPVQCVLGVPVFLLALRLLPEGWAQPRRLLWAAQVTIPLGLISARVPSWLLSAGRGPVAGFEVQGQVVGVVGCAVALFIGPWAARKAFAGLSTLSE